MVTIFRAHGLRIVIFSDDHEPAHVHVFGDGHAKINLLGANGQPELVWAEGMKRNEVRRAMEVVTEQQAVFLVRWRKIHG
jgi:histidinol phosphatase-like PHP family hydrolase